jgi:two-component system sensor histidine kinase MtrB
LVAEASLLGDQLDELPTDARRPAQLLVADVVRLRHLVEELMELSRLDAGQEDVSVRPTDVSAMLAALIDTRGWHDRVEVTGEAVTINTDPRRLERILANVLTNAIEHGGDPIQVRVSVDAQAVRVAVSDRGPGIAAEHLPRLFDRFYKADPARSGAGSGLGLAIAKENARLLGAELQVSSVVGAGTEFRVSLPVTRRLPGGEAPVEPDIDGEVHRFLEGEPS